MKKISLDKEFDKIWAKIEKGENIALLRYGDGERGIMCQRKVKALEGWEHPEHETKLSQELRKTLNENNDNLYYGISCPCCDQEAYYWYKTRIKSPNITFANLFVNENYERFATSFAKLNRDAVFIGNHRAKDKKIGNLNVLNYYSVSDDCVSFCEDGLDDLLTSVKHDFGARNDVLYVISAGPLSEIIISDLFKNNPNNCYIDFGSALDGYIHQKQTRSYQNPESKYAKRQCWMFDHSECDFGVSVVLSLYKRPHNLREQINAIKEQSLKPTEILIFQDGVSDGDKVPFPEELRSEFDRIETKTENVGVWGRFKFAQEANNQYVCLFDDDTIPGERWLENCHYNMQLQEGLYGTNGVICLSARDYPKRIINVGWRNPNKKLKQVDFVGHSWFFKKEWLGNLFNAPKKVQDLKICGEDMSFSYQILKERDIKTFVPPHPLKKPDLFGSKPLLAEKYGTSPEALSCNNENRAKYNLAMNVLVDDGWVTIIKKSAMRDSIYNVLKLTSSLLPSKKLRKKAKLHLRGIVYGA